jgi:hypothetical protein
MFTSALMWYIHLMHSDSFRPLIARFIFAAGLLLMTLGVALLLGTLTGVPRVPVPLSFLLVVLGSLCAALAVRLHRLTLRRSRYLFLATFFMLVGFFLFLSALRIFPLPLAQAWPLISIFSGLALLPAGWHHYGSFRSRYTVPSIAFVLLGCALLVFSLEMVPFSLTQFVLYWWPALVAVACLMLVLLSLKTRNAALPQPHHDEEESKS